MADVSAIQVKFAGLSPAFVLDGDLALSRWGLLLAARLAQSAQVWIPRSLWPLIDSDSLYRTRPALLDPDGEAVVDALGDWHAAWQGHRLRGAFHWFGDHRHEGQCPADS